MRLIATLLMTCTIVYAVNGIIVVDTEWKTPAGSLPSVISTTDGSVSTTNFQQGFPIIIPFIDIPEPLAFTPIDVVWLAGQSNAQGDPADVDGSYPGTNNLGWLSGAQANAYLHYYFIPTVPPNDDQVVNDYMLFWFNAAPWTTNRCCLLYTSDAADE